MNLNRDIYDKYQSTRTPINGLLLSDHIEKSRDSDISPDNFGYIKMNSEDRLCPFFTVERLCAVHRDLGEDCLSKTCAVYPRRLRISFCRHEISLSLSCPEAARLALLDPNPMRFDEIVLPSAPYASSIGTNEQAFLGIGLFFESVQLNIIRLLQRRSLSLVERLLVFGIFMKNLDDALIQNRPSEIPKIVAKYGNRLVEADIRKQVNAIRIDPAIPTAVLLELIAVSKMEGFFLPKFHCLVDDLARVLKVEKNQPLADTTNRYIELKSLFQKKIGDDLAYILENYLVHRVFQQSIPFTAGFMPFALYLQMVVNFTIIRLLMLGRAGADGDLTPERCAEVIQLVSKVLEHSPQCMKSIDALFAANRLDTLGHAAALLLA